MDPDYLNDWPRINNYVHRNPVHDRVLDSR